MKNIYIIFLILFLDLISFTIILPLFPSIIDFYDERDKSSGSMDSSLARIRSFMEWMKTTLNMPDRPRYNNVLVGGILGSMFSFLQFVCSPIIGSCSDIFGRKPLLIFCMLGTLCSYLTWWKAETFTIFLLSRVIGGLLKGSVTLSTTMMTDITTKEHRAKGMAFLGLAFSFGFITGPMIGAYFASKSRSEDFLTHAFAFPAQVAMFFQALSLLLVIFVLDETIAQKSKSDIKSFFAKVCSIINPMSLFFSSSNDKGSLILQRLTVINFLFILMFSGLEFTLTFLTHERFNFTSMQQGRLFLFSGIIMMLIQGGYVRRMKHENEKKIAIQGIVVMIPAMFTLAFASQVKIAYFGLLLYSFGSGTVFPCLTALFSQQSKDGESGGNIGIFRSASAFARAVAPFVTCSVYWIVGSTFCYVVGGLLFTIPLLLLIRTKIEKTVQAKFN